MPSCTAWASATLKGAGKAWPPASRTIAVRLGDGDWSTALERLGIPVSAIGRAKGSGRFDAEAILTVLADFIRESEEAECPPTFGAYTRWAQDLRSQGREDVPSPATVRQRFGTWTAAMEALTETGTMCE